MNSMKTYGMLWYFNISRIPYHITSLLFSLHIFNFLFLILFSLRSLRSETISEKFCFIVRIPLTILTRPIYIDDIDATMATTERLPNLMIHLTKLENLEILDRNRENQNYFYTRVFRSPPLHI